MNTLFLRLEANLQCYVTTDKHEGSGPRIRTNDCPSKSALAGMIAGAFGVPRHESVEALAELNTLTMGVRLDRLGVLTEDFQIANPPLITAAGTVSKDQTGGDQMGKTNIREYLADASFLVALQGDSGLIAECAKALNAPKFTPYYGRKCCVPTRPPFDGTGDFENLEAALASRKAVGWGPNKRWAVIERTSPTPSTIVSHDVLVNCHPFIHSARLIERKLVPVEPANIAFASLLGPGNEIALWKETAHTKKMKRARMKWWPKNHITLPTSDMDVKPSTTSVHCAFLVTRQQLAWNITLAWYSTESTHCFHIGETKSSLVGRDSSDASQKGPRQCSYHLSSSIAKGESSSTTHILSTSDWRWRFQP